MKFPHWVAQGKKRPAAGRELAVNRLRFIVKQAALMVDHRGTIMALAEHCDIDYQRVHLYVSRGAFSVGTAKLIEDALGRDVIRKEHLVFPLEIESE